MGLQEIKKLIIDRAKLKITRDKMLSKFEGIKDNPLSAMSMMGDVESLLTMTKQLEEMSEQLIQLMIVDIKTQEG